MFGSLSETLCPTETPLCTSRIVPGTLKPRSCIFLGACECSQTSLPMWAQMMCVYAFLQSLGAASSACFPWKGASNPSSPLSLSGMLIIGSILYFWKESQITFMLFQQQTELQETPTLCVNHILPSFFKPPTHKSVLVSIATGIVPPFFNVVSSRTMLYSSLRGEISPLPNTLNTYDI